MTKNAKSSDKALTKLGHGGQAHQFGDGGKMEFKEFCQGFYFSSGKTGGLKRVTSQGAIAEFILKNACCTLADESLLFTDDYFRKFFTGERPLTVDLLSHLCDCFDENQFTVEIMNKLNDSTLIGVMSKFGISVDRSQEPNKHAFAAALAAQFSMIIHNDGTADDTVSTLYSDKLQHSMEFPQYVAKTRDKYSKLKTLLYTSEEKPFYDFFVCNTIMPHYITRNGRRKKNRKAVIEHVTPEELSKYSRYVLLVGMGGIGKSMMMRHLFLTALDQYGRTGVLPILLTLREFTSEDAMNIERLMLSTVRRFDESIEETRLVKMLQMGECLILLDGYDEIKYSELEAFQHQLEVLLDRYPANQYVMSSRELSLFIELPRFSVMGMMEFSKEQSLELVQKLDFCAEEPNLKVKFLQQLNGYLFEKQMEFATNPLLLTLMLMNYRRFGGVPEKMHLFYAEAYETLLMRHDADKIAYRRVFHSVNDPADFTTVFREFCAKSYRKGDFEFDKALFEEYFDKLKSTSRLDKSKMRVDTFLFDVLHSVCMMYEESQSYHFLHRSFQEYFFADYYSRQNDNTLIKLGESLQRDNNPRHHLPRHGDMALSMLYDLAPEKVERFIVLPYLAKIFDMEAEPAVKFWTFMGMMFDSLFFTVILDEYKHLYTSKDSLYLSFSGCGVISVIGELVFKMAGSSPILQLTDASDTFASDELVEELLVARMVERDGLPKSNMLLPFPVRTRLRGTKDEARIKQLTTDEEGNSLIRGYQYRYPFSRALTKPECDPNIVAQLSREDSKSQKCYRRIEQLYSEIKERCRMDAVDDDDF